MSTTTEEGTLTKKDFVTPNDVRWCPGCGDYAILNAVQRTLPELGIPKEKYVVVSGIGCSKPFSILYEYLWLSYNTWKGSDCGYWSQGSEPRFISMDDYG